VPEQSQERGTLVVAGQVYDLIPFFVALPLALGVGAIAATLATRWRVPVIGWLGLLGALWAPAVLGALDDPVVRAADPRIVVNVGNFHSLAFHFEGEQIVGLLEHHTGELTPPQLEGFLTRLAAGTISNREVFESMRHGALVLRPARQNGQGARPFLAVTGPRRSMLRGSALDPYFAVPHGDMMLAGCFALLRAVAAQLPEYAAAIAAALDEERHSA